MANQGLSKAPDPKGYHDVKRDHYPQNIWKQASTGLTYHRCDVCGYNRVDNGFVLMADGSSYPHMATCPYRGEF